ncbi:MAG: hypothetical protein ABL860_05855, partial [Candidatus Nitrotoga sp.]
VSKARRGNPPGFYFNGICAGNGENTPYLDMDATSSDHCRDALIFSAIMIEPGLMSTFSEYLDVKLAA